MAELTIVFSGDWRVGAGAGLPGDVDELVRRDPDGLPMVPARTVTGMWRDGCERAAAALRGDWAQWVDVLFGSQPALAGNDRGLAPRAAALSVRTATLREGLRAALVAESPDVRAALHGVRTGVSIDPATRQAREKFLRMIEVTRGGLALQAPFELSAAGWDAAQRRTAGVLLALGAGEVRSLGGDRRRGLGRCRWELGVTDDVRRALEAPQPPEPAAVPDPVAPHAPARPVAGGADHVVLDIVVTCVDPVLSAAVATDSAVRGATIVPGARVLPVIVARARSAGLDVEHLIASGGLVVEPLVPEIAGAPGRAAPLVLAVPKGLQGPVWNRLRSPIPEGVAPKPLRDRWLSTVDGTGYMTGSTLEIRMHNTVSDVEQRPTEAVGGLFSYEAIPAGSVLRGRVHARIAADAADGLAAALSGRWRLGQAQKDEYGRVDAEVTVAAPDYPGVREAEQAVVWFVTDAVLLDGRLAPVITMAGVLEALGAALGAPVELAAHAPGCTSHGVSFGRVEAWQTRWVRPRPTLMTVAAGSVVLIRRTDGQPFGPFELDALVRGGIGERRAEGFGRVAVNDPILDGPEVDAGPPPVPDMKARPRPPLNGNEGELLEQLRGSAFRSLIEQRAAALPRRSDWALAKIPANQLAGLRAALAVTDAVSAGKVFLAHLDKAKVRGTRWPSGAREALGRLLDNEDEVWRLLGMPVAPPEAGRVERGWALRRVLAHLGAGGATAQPTEAPDGS